MNTDKSSPESRANRLRRVRNLANLSRKHLCETGTINLNTLKGWENANYGGLTEDGAAKVVERLQTEGVLCTTDWLLHETGLPPKLLNSAFSAHISADKAGNFHEERILEELALFESSYQDIAQCKITDDGMEPFYAAGDYVAGIHQYQDKIKKLMGKNCIVQLKNGALLVRQIRHISENNVCHLACLNPLTKIAEPVLYNVAIVCAAPIIRHFKKP